MAWISDLQTINTINKTTNSYQLKQQVEMNQITKKKTILHKKKKNKKKKGHPSSRVTWWPEPKLEYVSIYGLHIYCTARFCVSVGIFSINLAWSEISIESWRHVKNTCSLSQPPLDSWAPVLQRRRSPSGKLWKLQYFFFLVSCYI
jgi:hypothetical protein